MAVAVTTLARACNAVDKARSAKPKRACADDEPSFCAVGQLSHSGRVTSVQVGPAYTKCQASTPAPTILAVETLPLTL